MRMWFTMLLSLSWASSWGQQGTQQTTPDNIEPSEMVLFSDGDPSMVIRKVAGPYSLGEVVTLSCQVTGGHPTPKVTWWEGPHLRDNVSELESGIVTRNDFTLEPLTQADLNRSLTCLASNAEVTEPLTSTVTLELHYPPKSVKILSEKKDEVVVQADVEEDLVCRVLGSNPPPTVTWRIGGKMRPGKVSVDKELTWSILRLTPRPEENGSEVTCSAYNPKLTHTYITASSKLSVLYRPQVKLLHGLNLNLEDIQEGEDLDFKCDVLANPPPTAVQWTHDGELMVGGMKGVYVTDSSLQMENITRQASGNYSCSASNTEGTASSNAFLLKVKFAPVCAESQDTVIEASAHVQVQIGCFVEAYPPPTSFRWTMNTSAGEMNIPSKQFQMSDLSSFLTHTPPTQDYYRCLSCWAANQVGEQKSPCQFHIVPKVIKHVVPAAIPESVADCTVTESDKVQTSKEVEVKVKCEASADEGLSQVFILEVQDADHNVTQVRENQPIFTIKRLKVGIQYLLQVKAFNARGTSAPFTFTFTANHTSGTDSSTGLLVPSKVLHWFYTVVATTILLFSGSLVVVQMVVFLLWGFCCRRSNETQTHRPPQALHNGDSSMVEGLPMRPIELDTGSSASNKLVKEYPEREDQISCNGHISAPSSLCSDPSRSLSPSPSFVDPGSEEERIFVDGKD